MQMPPVSSILLDDEVTLTQNTWTTDVDGSRVVAATRVTYGVAASVLVGKPTSREIEIEPETGLRRVTEYTPITVQFDEDVSLNIHDLIGWTDPADAQHTYLVVGYGPLAGVAGAWVATCEERA